MSARVSRALKATHWSQLIATMHFSTHTSQSSLCNKVKPLTSDRLAITQPQSAWRERRIIDALPLGTKTVDQAGCLVRQMLGDCYEFIFWDSPVWVYIDPFNHGTERTIIANESIDTDLTGINSRSR